MALILTAGGVQGSLYPELFDLGWQAWFGAITMPLIGFVIGFVLAAIFCLKQPQRMAIGFETGIQNTALALTIISTSFDTAYMASFYSQFAILYTTFQVVFGIGSVVASIVYFWVRYHQNPCYVPLPDEQVSLEVVQGSRSSSSSSSGDEAKENGGLELADETTRSEGGEGRKDGDTTVVVLMDHSAYNGGVAAEKKTPSEDDEHL